MWSHATVARTFAFGRGQEQHPCPASAAASRLRRQKAERARCSPLAEHPLPPRLRLLRPHRCLTPVPSLCAAGRRRLQEGHKSYGKDDLGDMPGARESDASCGEWKVGTATGARHCTRGGGRMAAAALRNDVLVDVGARCWSLPCCVPLLAASQHRAPQLKSNPAPCAPLAPVPPPVTAGYSTDGTDKGDVAMHPNDLGEYVVP